MVASGRDPVKTKIKEVMKNSPFTCLESDELEKAFDTMASHQVRRIPVVDGNRRVVGIIAQGDIATRLDEPKKTGVLVAKISQ